MGQLTASVAHEVNQPIAATVTNAQAALRWLSSRRPKMDEARQALGRIVRDGNRAGAVVGRIRNLIKKEPPGDERLDINAAIRDVIEVTRSESMKNGVSVQTELAEGLPPVRGDRVELQQVILNLTLNALEAMSEMSEGSRELVIGAGTTGSSDDVLVTVRDSGPGLAPSDARASLRGLLHDQAERLGAWPVDLPFDHRSARRTTGGERQCAPRRDLSVHAARPPRQCIPSMNPRRSNCFERREPCAGFSRRRRLDLGLRQKPDQVADREHEIGAVHRMKWHARSGAAGGIRRLPDGQRLRPVKPVLDCSIIPDARRNQSRQLTCPFFPNARGAQSNDLDCRAPLGAPNLPPEAPCRSLSAPCDNALG
jgi:His Kinase A (phospho-acceptor) domain